MEIAFDILSLAKNRVPHNIYFILNQSSIMTKPIQLKSLKILLVSVLGLSCIFVSKNFLSSLLAVRPASVVQMWAEKPNTFDKNLALNFVSRIQKSIHLNPSNLDHYFVLANLYSQVSARSANEVDYSEEIIQNFREIIRLQPTSHYAWALLAKHYKSHGQHKEAMISLKRASFFGPFEYETQKTLIPLIVFYWDQLLANGQLNGNVSRVIEHILSFRRFDMRLLREANKQDKLEFIAPLVKTERQVKFINKYFKQKS